MSDEFGLVWAGVYDLMYIDKDYIKECDLIEDIFHKFGDGAILNLLDLGCGTGNHTFPLAARGYHVTGVDRSKDMLRQANGKLEKLAVEKQPILVHGDVCSLDLNQRFDAVIMMFAVLGYQTSNNQLRQALSTVRRHLRPGGLFLFDVWYGPAVLAERPSDRVRVLPTSTGRIIRLASSTLDLQNHLCTVHFHLFHLAGDRIVDESEEHHGMRFFFPLELTAQLESNGLSLVHLGAFPELAQEASETTWNVMVVSKAI